MSFKRTIVIALIFLLAGSYYYFFEFKGRSVRDELKRKESSVFSFDESNVSNLIFSRIRTAGMTKLTGKDKFIFEKRDKTWYINEPVESKADRETIESLVKSLTSSQKGEVIDDSGKELEKFGLNEPSYELVISDGSKEEVLLLGSKTIDDRNFYAKLKNNPKVFLIDINFKYNLDKNIDDYRDRTVVEISRDEVTKVVYHKNKNTFVFDKVGDNWVTTHAKIPRPGSDEIATFVHYLTGLKAKSFIPNTPASQEKLGIKDSNFWLEIYGRDYEKPVLLRFGEPDVKTGSLYAAVVGANDIFAIPLIELEKLNKIPSDFIERRLLRIDSSDVSKFESNIEGSAYVFQKEEADKDKKRGDSESKYTWKITSPNNREIDSSPGNNIISSISNMYVKDAFIPQKSMSEYGLDRPAFHAKGFKNDHEMLFEVDFGIESSDPGNQDCVYARVKGEKSVLLVNKASVEKLKQDIVNLAGKPEKPQPSPSPKS
jgi:hypothetical protein